jgi:tight adherence protein C
MFSSTRSKSLEQLVSAGRLLLPGSGTELRKTTERLGMAGFRQSQAAPLFFGVKVLLAIALPLVMWPLAWPLGFDFAATLTLVVAAALFGLILPNLWLDRRIKARQKRLRDAFPDALDLLVICVEAGLGLTAAIERVATELQFSHPELAEELALVNIEIRAGVDRETALKNLAPRTGLTEVRGLAGLLVQTLQFGTSIAETLRVYSAEFRDQRMQQAQERAGTLGTRLIFPLIFCEFPAFFAVAVGPAVLRIIDALKLV